MSILNSIHIFIHLVIKVWPKNINKKGQGHWIKNGSCRRRRAREEGFRSPWGDSYLPHGPSLGQVLKLDPLCVCCHIRFGAGSGNGGIKPDQLIVFVDILFLNPGNGFHLVLFECFIFVNILFYILTYLKILFVCWSGCINEISISWYEKKEKFDVLFSPQIVCKCNRPCRFIQWEQKY